MAQNPVITKLDYEQVITRVYDEPNDRLRVDAEITANISGAQEVIISHDDDSIKVYGTDGVTDRQLKTDSNGELQVDVLSSALPAGAATSANQATEISLLTDINTDQTNGDQQTQIVDGLGNVISSTGNALDVNIASGITLEVNLDEANDSVQIYGNDGVLNRAIKTDAAGELQIDVLSSALPAGAATESTLAALNAKVNDNYGASSGAIRTASQVGNATGAADFGAGTTTAQTQRVVLPTDQTAIPVTDNGGSLTVDGTVTTTQGTSPWVTNVSQFGGSAVVTGTGNSGAGIPRVTVSNDSSITNISGTISLPTGAATAANQATANASLASIDAGIPVALGQTTAANSMPVVLASDQSAFTTNFEKSTTSALTNVTITTASTSVIAANANRKMLTIYNDAGRNIYIKLNSAAASTTSFTIRISDNSYYELPLPIYTGAITAISNAGSGDIRVTEFT